MFFQDLEFPIFTEQQHEEFSSSKIDSAEKNLIDAAIAPDCFFSIVIPIRNEAEFLYKTLSAFSRQTDLRNSPLDANFFEIILLINNSQDDSAKIARNWQAQNKKINLHIVQINLPTEKSNIGFIRRFLMNEAYKRLKQNKFRGGIIATTDGDTQVSPDWIAANIEEIKNGADAVGGRILINLPELEQMDSKARNFHLLDEEYRLLVAEMEHFFDNLSHDSHPRHYQHFNASIAVTTDIFAKAGGVPKVNFLEDVAFYQSLMRIDAKFRHSQAVKVFTSARHVGRTEEGLSTQINKWKMMGQNGDVFLVESAQAIERRLVARNNLRNFLSQPKSKNKYDHKEIIKLAGTFYITPNFLAQMLNQSQTFGCLLEKVYKNQARIGEWSNRNPQVPVEIAISDLRRKLEKLRGESPSSNLYAKAV